MSKTVPELRLIHTNFALKVGWAFINHHESICRNKGQACTPGKSHQICLALSQEKIEKMFYSFVMFLSNVSNLRCPSINFNNQWYWSDFLDIQIGFVGVWTDFLILQNGYQEPEVLLADLMAWPAGFLLKRIIVTKGMNTEVAMFFWDECQMFIISWKYQIAVLLFIQIGAVCNSENNMAISQLHNQFPYTKMHLKMLAILFML